MKFLNPALVLLIGTLIVEAADVPIRSMASELPTVRDGFSISTYPVPRTDWTEKVAENFKESQKSAASIEVVLDGDSITELFQKKKVWRECFPRVKSYNFAMIGDRTQHLLWRLSQGQLDNIRPKLVILLIGTNNLGTGQSVEDTIAGIKAVVAEYQKRCPDAAILLQGIFPRGQGTANPLRAEVKAVNEAIAKLGDGKNIIYADFGEKFLTADGGVDPKLMPDYLHPNKEGFKVWAAALKHYVETYAGAK